MDIKIIKNKNSQKGQVMMVIVMAMAGVIIGATAVSGLLTARQTRQTADIGSSEISVFAADAGLEWRMYKLYTDYKKGNLCDKNGKNCSCSDCDDGLACDKKPQFDDNSIQLIISCSLKSDSGGYLIYNIQSTAKVKNTSYSVQQSIRLIK